MLLADIVLLACVGVMVLTAAIAALVWVIGKLSGGQGQGGEEG